MNFDNIKVNNRLQIESENPDASLRSIRGIVLNRTEKTITLLTDFGKIIAVEKDNILNISRVAFDRVVSEALMELKNHYLEIEEKEEELNEKRGEVTALVESLYDANFLAKFNAIGAKSRLNNSIRPELLSFEKGVHNCTAFFEIDESEELYILLVVESLFEYFNASAFEEEKLIRAYFPDNVELLEKIFQKKVTLLNTEVNYLDDDLIRGTTSYRVDLGINQENFIKEREQIKASLIMLKSEL